MTLQSFPFKWLSDHDSWGSQQSNSQNTYKSRSFLIFPLLVSSSCVRDSGRLFFLVVVDGTKSSHSRKTMLAGDFCHLFQPLSVLHSSPILDSLPSRENVAIGFATRNHRAWVHEHHRSQPSGRRDQDCLCLRLQLIPLTIFRLSHCFPFVFAWMGMNDF